MVELWPYIDERSNQFFDPSNNVAVATLFVNIFVTLSTDFFLSRYISDRGLQHKIVAL